MCRIPSKKTSQEVGAKQAQALAALLAGCHQALDIVLAYGKYGNASFLGQVQSLRIGMVAHLHRDRVLYRPARPETASRRGCPRTHRERFYFQDPTTWGDPNEVQELEDERFGKVRLELWNCLHERRVAELVYDLKRARVYLEWEKPPEAVWYA